MRRWAKQREIVGLFHAGAAAALRTGLPTSLLGSSDRGSGSQVRSRDEVGTLPRSGDAASRAKGDDDDDDAICVFV